MKLIYKKDKYGKEILCNEDESQQIMMEWEKPYMEKSIELLNPFGKVLEIGFGLGYSASKICSYKNVSEYNVIECSPMVWNKFKEFKKNQILLRPELKINLIKGRWEDVLETLYKYDCIYFDDFILDIDKIDNNIKNNDRLSVFLYRILKKHTIVGSKISFYSTINCENYFHNIKCIDGECHEFKIDIPDNCMYTRGNLMYIPLMTKNKDDDIELDNFLNNNLKKNNSIKVSGINESITKELEKHKRYKKLLDDIRTRNPSCGLIIIDDFYTNAYDTRNFVLTQDFLVRGNYPGQRTISYANNNLKDIIQEYVQPFGGKIIDFPIPKEDCSDSEVIYNGSFQYTTSRDRSWIHIDGHNNWAGVLYLTPNAPVTSGTTFYKFYDGTACKRDMEILDNKSETDKFSQDMTKWIKVDQVGNVFNRLILFNSNRFHMSIDYFGDTKENGRLFQVFFFSTEK